MGAIYLTDNSTITSNNAHCVYLVAADLVSSTVVSQGFGIVYSTISMESMMHGVSLPVWTATSYVVCCLAMCYAAIIIDICVAISDRIWIRTVYTIIMTTMEFFLAITAVAYWSVDVQISDTLTFTQTSGVVVIGARGGGDTLIGQRRNLRMNALRGRPLKSLGGVENLLVVVPPSQP